MENSNKSEHGILWVGDKAMETYLRTDQNVLKSYTNYLLLFDKLNAMDSEDVTYLKDLTKDGELDYESNQLAEPIEKYFTAMKHEKFNLVIGSPYELLVQKIIDMTKERSGKESNLEKEEYPLFSFNHFRNKLDNKLDFEDKDVLFLKQNIPFSDMKSDAKHTIKRAKKSYRQGFSTLNEVGSLNEFLFRFYATPNELNNCKEVETID
jgi:hypothetical protein